MPTKEVLNAIPHRPPFLFVDEVVESSDESLTAKFHVDASLPFFEGHYPGNPIMPGVLLSEAIFQTGAIYVSKLLEKEGDDLSAKVPVLTKIMDARFRTVTRPGDDLFITVKFKQKMGGFIFMDGGIKNGDGKRVMNVTFNVTLTDPV